MVAHEGGARGDPRPAEFVTLAKCRQPVNNRFRDSQIVSERLTYRNRRHSGIAAVIPRAAIAGGARAARSSIAHDTP